MATINWETVYKTEIEIKPEHNNHFTLEEFMSYPDWKKELLRASYNTTSLLDTIRAEVGIFEMDGEKNIPACNEDSCDLIDEFLTEKPWLQQLKKLHTSTQSLTGLSNSFLPGKHMLTQTLYTN
jgi:hypothetical protein